MSIPFLARENHDILGRADVGNQLVRPLGAPVAGFEVGCDYHEKINVAVVIWNSARD